MSKMLQIYTNIAQNMMLKMAQNTIIVFNFKRIFQFLLFFVICFSIVNDAKCNFTPAIYEKMNIMEEIIKSINGRSDILEMQNKKMSKKIDVMQESANKNSEKIEALNDNFRKNNEKHVVEINKQNVIIHSLEEKCKKLEEKCKKFEDEIKKLKASGNSTGTANTASNGASKNGADQNKNGEQKDDEKADDKKNDDKKKNDEAKKNENAQCVNSAMENIKNQGFEGKITCETLEKYINKKDYKNAILIATFFLNNVSCKHKFKHFRGKVLYYLGLAYYSKKDYDSALSAFTSSYQANSNGAKSVAALEHMAKIFKLRKETAKYDVVMAKIKKECDVGNVNGIEVEEKMCAAA